MLIAYMSDKLRHRFSFAVFSICVSLSGFGILLAVTRNYNVEYGALFLVTMGTYGAMPIVVCWFTQNLGGHHRRAVGTAWQIGFGNIGGIIATVGNYYTASFVYSQLTSDQYAFLSKDQPLYYKPGYSICIGFACLSAASCFLYFLAVLTQNRNRNKAPTDLSLTEFDKTEKGDMSPDYRYQL